MTKHLTVALLAIAGVLLILTLSREAGGFLVFASVVVGLFAPSDRARDARRRGWRQPR